MSEHEFPRDDFEQNGVHVLTDAELDEWISEGKWTIEPLPPDHPTAKRM